MRVVLSLLLAAGLSLASAISFTGALNADDPNDLFVTTLTLPAPTRVVIQSFGYGGSSNAPGGTNAAGTIIDPGGFDTYLSLFAGTGPAATFLVSNDDGSCPPGAAIPVCRDSTLDLPVLATGSYTVVLSVVSNFSFAENLGTGTLGDGFIGLGSYFDSASGEFRTPNYALDIMTGLDSAPVPEPTPMLLIGAGLAGFVALRKWLEKHKRAAMCLVVTLTAAFTVPMSSCISGGPQPGSSRPYLDGVVQIRGGGRTCTGVLITPRLVLTAAHCFGFNSANPTDRGISGGDTRCVIENAARRVIGVGGCGAASFTHLDGKATETATVQHVWVVEGRSPGAAPHGRDLAIASLNLRATPKTAAAAPSTPAWFEGDPGAEHWKRAEIVYAGWGLIDLIADTCEGLRTASRSATRLGVEWRKRLDGSIPVDSNSVSGPLGTPMFVANFNLYGDSTGLVLSGDSGGPLFSPDPTGAIRVIGTTSGNACFDSELSGTIQDLWARTFNEDNAALLRRVVMASNGRVRGSDVSFSDTDGDGVAESPLPDSDPNIGELDNCPDRFNPDQKDSDNDGIGDACASCPGGVCDRTPDPPTNCRLGPHGANCGYANLQCDAPLPAADHRVVDGTNRATLPTIYQDSRAGRIDVAYTAAGSAELAVCLKVGRAPERCGSKFTVTLGPSTCTGGSVPPEFRCPSGQIRCQGACRPITECRFPK